MIDLPDKFASKKEQALAVTRYSNGNQTTG